MKKLFGVVDVSSSVDPEALGKTVEGIIGGISSLVILFATFQGVVILPTEWQALAANIGATTAATGVAISSIITTYGLIRKLLVRFSY